MPTIVLAGPIARYLPSPHLGETSFRVGGATVREAVEQLCSQIPQLRGYVLDDQGALRHHVAVFVNGVVVHDKHSLAEPVPADGEIWCRPRRMGVGDRLLVSTRKGLFVCERGGDGASRVALVPRRERHLAARGRRAGLVRGTGPGVLRRQAPSADRSDLGGARPSQSTPRRRSPPPTASSRSRPT
ncbi:MAG: hypothetical protein U0797_21130 [Gemmataceae bacterium]